MGITIRGAADLLRFSIKRAADYRNERVVERFPQGNHGRPPSAVDAAALRGLQLAAIYGDDLQPVCVDLFH